MKEKNYEKDIVLFITIVIFIVIVIIYSIYLSINKINRYVLLNGIVNTKDTILLLVNDEQLDLLYDNKNIYIDDSKKVYEIRKVTLKTLRKDKVYYHEVIIKTKFNKKYKEGDYILITVKKNKQALIKMFKLIWKGESDGES